ncbi:unnamed protein product [Gulo gulo]|uniref:Uncharacterized protein n=1 Tax=Gulo gulo TaxID=48420 RepID=A0A9X9LLZ0_GULGU|nr:unnamed protein product [Gulo gulo]
MRRKSGEASPGSGDLTFLTTEPNRVWNPGNQAPTFQRQPPAQLISLEILKRRTCLHVASQSPEAAGRGNHALQTLSLAGDVLSALPDISGHLAGSTER